jgi:flagellar biosynthesis/type III secretory pathway protein FliH
MILRGAVLSDSRLALDSARAGHLGDAPKKTASALDADAHAREPVIVERIVPAPITFDAVVEWMRQDDSRERLARHLADDVEAVRAAARAEGLAAGKAEGLVNAKAQSQSILEALEALVSRADLAFEAEVTELSALCAEVVCAALAKIAGPVLSMREAAVGTVLEVLKRVKEERDLVIRVSTQDLPALQESADEIEKACAGRKFNLVADPRVDAGGCLIESSLGSLDGRFDVQLRALAETLRAAKSAGAESA